MNPPEAVRPFRKREVFELEHHGTIVEIPALSVPQLFADRHAPGKNSGVHRCTCGAELDIRWNEAANA